MSTSECCTRCDVPMRSRKSDPRPGTRIHLGRGLCVNCRNWARRRGLILDYPRITRPRDDLLDDYVLLRGEGYTWRQCAERLGMNYPAFRRAMERARTAGDPRAGRPGERWPVTS